MKNYSQSSFHSLFLPLKGVGGSLLFLIAILFASCGGQTKKEAPKADTIALAACPRFSASNAMQFINEQCEFGPRVTGSEASRLCGDYLVERFKAFGAEVEEQTGIVTIWDGSKLPARNIVARINPSSPDRILLCAHWDSRPWADNDEDEANYHTPILAANDGASGVGVLLECARLFKAQPLPEKLGIDIILFDLEDYGPHQDEAEKYYDDRVNYWALGSQYWSKHPHVYGYRAYYGVLLDMVGGSNPNFQKEYYSQGYAAWVSNKIWRKAYDMGYRPYFNNELGPIVSDDHLPMNQMAGIPTVDIIDLQPESSNGCFPEVWHTLNDNLENIDRTTLGMVGDVLLHVVYEE